jgi:LuxR family maltose regulon positive regulatory protein
VRRVPEAAAAALAARTEGWAAGLQLAGLSLRGRGDVGGFVAAFTGSHRYVLDYLAEEVLERQPGRVRESLLETSVLEQLSGELCDAVTGRPGSQALLEQVERAGLFVVPLDEVRGWWRYHQLCADLLRARLQQEQPGGVSGLHRNAAAWYAGRGLADDAIRHAVAAEEMIWAARLIEQHYDELFYLHGEGATVHRWLSALPEDLVRSRPRLLLTQAFLALISGRLEAVEPLLDVAQQAHARAAEEPLEPTVGRARSLLVNVPALIAIHRGFLAQLRSDADATVAFASRAMAEADEGERLLHVVARRYLAVGEWLRGQLAQAERTFTSSIAEWRAAGLPTVTAWVLYLLGQVQRAQGGLDASARTARQALEMTAVPGRAPPPAAGPGVRGPGGGGLPAERARYGAAAHHRGHHAVPPVRLHPAAGHRPGHAGVAPAGRAMRLESASAPVDQQHHRAAVGAAGMDSPRTRCVRDYCPLFSLVLVTSGGSSCRACPV